MNYRQLMPASSNFSQKSAEPTKGEKEGALNSNYSLNTRNQWELMALEGIGRRFNGCDSKLERHSFSQFLLVHSFLTLEREFVLNFNRGKFFFVSENIVVMGTSLCITRSSRLQSPRTSPLQWTMPPTCPSPVY